MGLSKDYKALYQVYWLKYRILDEYVKGLLGRIEAVAPNEELSLGSESYLVEEALRAAEMQHEDECNEVDKARADYHAKVKEATERLAKITEEYEKGGWHMSV